MAKIFKSFTTVLGITLAGAPFLSLIACNSAISDGLDRTSLSNPEVNLKDKLITDRDNYTDILISMGIKPTGQAMSYKLALPNYFKNLGVNVPIFEGFVANYGSPFNIEAFSLYSPKLLIGSGPSSNQFSNVYEPNYNVMMSPSEEVTVITSDNVAQQKTFELVDLYAPWMETAKKVDAYYSKNNDYQKKMQATVDFIFNKITAIRNELKAKLVNVNSNGDKNSLVFYSWGQDKDSDTSDLSDLEIYQEPLVPIGPLGSLLYSNKGLAFKQPQFDITKKLGIGQYGVVPTRGTAQIHESLALQNDLAIISFNYPQRINPELKEFKESDWASKLAKDSKNIKLLKDVYVPTASYGPNGINYILNWFIEEFKLSIVTNQIPGVSNDELKIL